GIADLVGESGELARRLNLGGVAHPAKGLQPVVEDRLEVAATLQRRCLGLRREILCDVSLAEGIPKSLVGGAGAALVARQHFLGAAQRAGETEILVHERRAEA